MLLGEILKEDGYITAQQLDLALIQQKEDNSKKIGEILIENNFISEQQLLNALSKRLQVPVIQLDDYPIDIEAVKKLPRKIAVEYNAIAIQIEESDLIVAINDPLNFYAIEDIKLISNMPVKIVIALKDDIIKAINNFYTNIAASDKSILENFYKNRDSTIKIIKETESVPNIEVNENAAPIVNLVNSILIKAENSNASDIHIEPFDKISTVRFRIDGQLVEHTSFDISLHQFVVSRIKILSDLDIAEKRIPQDGHFKVKINDCELNIRVSTTPVIYGEKIVMRLLKPATNLDYVGQFGMNDENYKKFSQALKSPYGVIYITGPTGSGKTTTLYMIIEQFAKKNINISTIEDPVERNLAHVNQMQINNAAGVTFASGLRSFLRQDPDVIMVGETRDEETASTVISAAITGHLVFSTLHTNDTLSSITRLEDMGAQSYLVASSLVCAVAQRLVRKICPACKEKYEPTPQELELIPNAKFLYRGKGCKACNNTGYLGRIAVHEVLLIDSTIREMISHKKSSDEIYNYLRSKKNFKTLAENAIALALDGTTSFEEVLKVASFIM